MSIEPSAETDEATLAHLRSLSRVLDGAVRIPGTQFRVGLDPILGLIPGLGDWLGGLLSGYIVVRAAGLGASKATVLRMFGNLALDSLIGTVPVLGDIFDFGFRANQRNLRLIDAHMQAPAQRRRADVAVVVLVAVGALTIVVGAFALMVFVVSRIVGALTG